MHHLAPRVRRHCLRPKLLKTWRWITIKRKWPSSVWLRHSLGQLLSISCGSHSFQWNSSWWRQAVLQCCHKEVPSLVKAVTVVTCIWGAPSSNFDRINEYCDRFFCSFPQTDVRMVLELTPLLLPDTSFHFIIYQSAIRHCMVSTTDSVVKWTINVIRLFCGSPRLSPSKAPFTIRTTLRELALLAFPIIGLNSKYWYVFCFINCRERSGTSPGSFEHLCAGHYTSGTIKDFLCPICIDSSIGESTQDIWAVQYE